MGAQPRMPGWARALFIIFGVISVIVSFAAMFRPWITVELVLILIPLVLLINGVSWIIQGAAGK